MGLNIGVNAITSGGLFIVAIFLLIMAILILSAEKKIKEIPEFSQSKSLQDGRNKLQTSYILAFIAAGIALVLSIVYSGHEIWWCPTEWIHTVFFLIIIVLWLIAVIYIYSVMSDLYNPELEDINGTDNFIWAALWISLLAFLALFVVMSGRVGYNMTKDAVADRFTELEHKVHLTHSHLTGEPVDYDKITAEGPNTIMVIGPDGNQILIAASPKPKCGQPKCSQPKPKCNQPKPKCNQPKPKCNQPQMRQVRSYQPQPKCNQPQMKQVRSYQPLVGPPPIITNQRQYIPNPPCNQPQHVPMAPSPSVQTMTRTGPVVTTRETITTQSQPLVSTTTTTELSRSQPAGFF